MAILHPFKPPVRSIGGWDLLERIADSGMGTVYKAKNRASGAIAAVKVMPPFSVGKEQAFQRFARECRILTALHDPHIVRAMDFGIEGAEPYLVMEFVEGETLRERVARTGGVPEAEAVGLIAEAAGALGRAHARGLVHRNVTPDSIVIRADGRAVLTDLCLIKEMDASGGGVTRDGTALGTPNFMAPEQIRNSAKANRSCDIYSLAATLYMAVTGQPPFAGCDILTMFQQKKSGGPILPRNLMPALSERTDRAIRRAMSAEPIHRPETCEEFLDNLTGTAPFEILGETPVQPAPTPPQPAPVPVARPAPVAMKIAPIRSEKKITAPAPSWLVRLWRWLISAETAAVTNASSTRAPSPSETNGRRVVRRRRVVRLPTNPKSPA